MFPRLLIMLLSLPLCTPADTITPTHPLGDGEVLVSEGGRFALGFFSVGNPNHRYVGVWYLNISEQIVWMLNRDDPINDTSGVLSIRPGGDLALHCRKSTIWSTNVSVSPGNSTVAQLLDTGNLVLIEKDSKKVLWQGFDYPTDTMLPYMKFGVDRKTGLDRFLTSWMSPHNPGTGEYSYRMEINGSPQPFLRKGVKPIWRNGPWIGFGWASVPKVDNGFVFNVSFLNNEDEVSQVLYGIVKPSLLSILKLDIDGVIRHYGWHEWERQWVAFWSTPTDSCDTYGQCGPNGNCNLYTENYFQCTCLAGFIPQSARAWSMRDGSGGCVRKQGANVCRSGEGFIKVEQVKIPDTAVARVDTRLSLEECREKCLSDCNCSAYTSANMSGGGSGCLAWYGDLMDTRSFAKGGQHFYLRVDATTLAHTRETSIMKRKWMIVLLTVGVAFVTVLMVSFLWLAVKKIKGKGRQDKALLDLSLNVTSLEQYSEANQVDENKTSSELYLFDLSTIIIATNNFSSTNKLGQGGFGSVYKGQLSNGQEIAVKRLSKDSGQGMQEFKNEVTLIAKLQHRNLVKLLGCCIEKEEKMLIYEFLPNKSLDSFIFDEAKGSMLSWTKRFEIINGIARGVLYLHQDSRLRIIHRDLKVSNILLDIDMIPKISDFGMAKLFGGNQIEGSTQRVVGTYGYMSPEYAMKGVFSIKSDVYSFGVLLLEIVTGRRNASYYCDNLPFNLVGHVWNLWKENKSLDAVDPSLGKSTHANEMLRCIQIGLLCVQESAIDRPSMPTVIFMLGNNSTLPSPTQPAFTMKTFHGSASSFGAGPSLNDVTITLDAR